MKKFSAIAALAVVTALLQGCVFIPAVSEDFQERNAEATFVSSVRTSYPEISEEYSDEELIEFGNEACDVIDRYGYEAGKTVTLLELIERGQTSAAVAEFAGAIYGNADRLLCPDQTDQSRNWSQT